MAEFDFLIRKDVLIGQFPSKSDNVFSKLGWVSIPSKFFDKVFDAGLHDQRKLTNFFMENFDRVKKYHYMKNKTQ